MWICSNRIKNVCKKLGLKFLSLNGLILWIIIIIQFGETILKKFFYPQQALNSLLNIILDFKPNYIIIWL